MKWLWLMAYVATIVITNLALIVWGVVPLNGGVLNFGIMAPAGAYFVSLNLAIRDQMQDPLGKRWTWIGMLIGVAITAAMSGPLALASGGAFLAAETLDYAIYTPLRARGWRIVGILASVPVSDIVDSALFLWLAFGSLDFIAGQVIAKWEVMAAYTAVLVAIKYWRARRALSIGGHLANPLSQPAA